MEKKIIIYLLCSYLSTLSVFSSSNRPKENIRFDIDATSPSDKKIPFIANIINIWDMGQTFFYPKVEFGRFNIFRFVHWVQLMQCSGGSLERDLFTNPRDRKILTDYNFESLIRNCDGIIALGAKPYLKLGGVPLKLVSNPKISKAFNMNVYPPDSYTQYYEYLKALLNDLVNHFGKKEVQSWRFGCMTEYENIDWFQARSGKAEDCLKEYCKLYDYTAQALIDVLGNNVFISAHSATEDEGIWDEREFIKHVAKGKNWANGGKGTKISGLSISYYDKEPGSSLSGRDLPSTIKILQNAADLYGLRNIVFGVDEGRILVGTCLGNSSISLLSRTCGYTWQGSYDARIYLQAIDNGIDYFSSWSFLTGSSLIGYPTISYHVAENIDSFGNYKRIKIKSHIINNDNKNEIGCLSGIEADTIKIMLYNYSNKVHASGKTSICLDIKLPHNWEKIKIIKKLIDDNCNYFDEWVEDREKYGINNIAFSWSPDDPMIDNTTTLSDNKVRSFYYKYLRKRYIKASIMKPNTYNEIIHNNTYTKNVTVKENNVLFINIINK